MNGMQDQLAGKTKSTSLEMERIEDWRMRERKKPTCVEGRWVILNARLT